jgi:hypothetical protein
MIGKRQLSIEKCKSRMLSHTRFFIYPQLRVKDCSEKPAARAGPGGKGMARTCNVKPDRRFYQRGERHYFNFERKY